MTGKEGGNKEGGGVKRRNERQGKGISYGVGDILWGRGGMREGESRILPGSCAAVCGNSY